MMAWSRLKSRWRSLLAPSVAGRVDVHLAGYRKAYEGRGRAWLTVDGVEIASFCELSFEHAWRAEGRRERPEGWPFSNSAHDRIRAAGMLDKADLLNAMGACIGSSIEEQITSADPVVRALAMLDRRLGKRRLARINPATEHPLVVRLHALRCEAEAVVPSTG